MRCCSLLVLAAHAIGCDAGEASAPPSEPPIEGCPVGTWPRDDGGCAPAGVPPDMPCPPAHWQRDGTCIPAGVPPDGCGAGFSHDGDRGCDPILPPAPCAPGLMAIPGETMCREVAPCAVGKWGDIPVEPNSEYVDATYAGMDSDGSALKPWTSIQAGIDAAASGAIVAVAAGSYGEDVAVSGKAVRLWGVCPALVEVVGTGAEWGALLVHGDAAGTEVRDLAVRGAAIGVVSVGSVDVRLERVWVHDAIRGVDVTRGAGPTGIALRGSLIERNSEVGMFVAGAEVTLETSVVRETKLGAQGSFGRGINEQADVTGVPSTLVVRASVLEQNHEFGVFVEGSVATLEESVVRETQPNAALRYGRGVSVKAHPNGAPSTLVIRNSVVAQNSDVGVLVAGSHGTLETSVVRETAPAAEGFFGHGVSAQHAAMMGSPATLVVRTSLIEQNHEFGIFVVSSDATVEASVVRGTQPNLASSYGRGVDVQADALKSLPATLVMSTSLIEHNQEVGLFVGAAKATVDASVVRATKPGADGFGGQAVHARAHPTAALVSELLLERSTIEESSEVAVAVMGSVATLHACDVRHTAPVGDGLFGDALLVLSEPGAADVTITATRIDASARAAVAAFGAHAAIGGSLLSCQAIDFDTESYGTSAATLENLGGNACGCPEPSLPCKAVSADLAPPTPLVPASE